MAAEPDAARVTRAGFKRQEQRAADAARLAHLNRRRQQRASAGANAGVGGAAGGSSTAAGSARFESTGHTHPPRPTAFEGARSMGPSRDIFKCAVLLVARPWRHQRPSRLSLSQHELWTYGRFDEEWTQLLKDGPGADARLFVDYFLVRLPAKEVVRRFAHEGLRLSAPRAFVSVRAPAHPSSVDDVSTRELPIGCVGSSSNMVGLSPARQARVFATEARGHGQCISFRRTLAVAMRSLSRGLGRYPAPAHPCLGEHSELLPLRVRR